jgi:hypothetical protein
MSDETKARYSIKTRYGELPCSLAVSVAWEELVEHNTWLEAQPAIVIPGATIGNPGGITIVKAEGYDDGTGRDRDYTTPPAQVAGSGMGEVHVPGVGDFPREYVAQHFPEYIPDRWVTQTTFYDPAKPEDHTGNCTEAAIASLLSVPLASVPSFRFPDATAHWEAVDKYIGEMGFWLVFANATYQPDGLYLATGPAARGCTHVVVMDRGELKYDPHPSRIGLLSVDHVIYLVPKGHRRHHRAALSARPAVEGAQGASGEGWLPIESAPRDGTTVDIWVPYGEGKGFRIINTSWKHHDWMNGQPRSPKAWDRGSPDGPLPEPSHWRLPPPAPGQPDPGIAVPLGSWTLDGRWRHNGRLQMSEQDQRAHNVKHGFMKCTHGVTMDDSTSDTGRRCMLCNEPAPALGEG